MKTKAIVAHHTGDPEVLSYEDIEIKSPGQGEVLIKNHAIGVNFIDTYFRSGVYPWPADMPIIPGAEAAGEIVELGQGVFDFQVGDRVAYTTSTGCYVNEKVLDATRIVKIPDELDDELVAGSLLKGLTAHYLLHRTFKVKPGHIILYHAAAGGVGLFVGQWAAHLGATVIGTVSTKEKAELAKQNGYSHIINYKKEDFVTRVMELTDGRGVDVVYDSVGQDTYPHSLKCIRRLGMWVSFGQSSGKIKNFNIYHLNQYGSLFTTRPSLFHYIATRQELEDSVGQLFEALSSGVLNVGLHQKYSLIEAPKVHELLETRQTKGSSILIP